MPMTETEVFTVSSDTLRTERKIYCLYVILLLWNGQITEWELTAENNINSFLTTEVFTVSSDTLRTERKIYCLYVILLLWNGQITEWELTAENNINSFLTVTKSSMADRVRNVRPYIRRQRESVTANRIRLLIRFHRMVLPYLNFNRRQEER